MDRFRTGEADLLISTTVIEVGVDIPNATVMLVENAERFGLAQLHQLRGRIGRGEHRSFCVLFDESEPENEEARARIDAMVRTTDGFELADEDLRLRGEGTLFDTKQSGMPDLKLARLAEDMELVKRARARAFAVIEDDPHLERAPRAPGGAAAPVRTLDRLALPLVGWRACASSAGSAKGTRLAPVPDGVRPLSDRAREGLFSSLGPDVIVDAIVLDLFAGTGAVGIEALSRGAARATFVERSAQAGATIHRNLDITRLAADAVVQTLDVASVPGEGRAAGGPVRPRVLRSAVRHGRERGATAPGGPDLGMGC